MTIDAYHTTFPRAKSSGIVGPLRTLHHAVRDSRRQQDIAVAAIVAVHLLIALFLIWELPIWRDEAHSLGTTADGFLTAVRRGIYYELQPPAYFALLGLWREINGSIFFARLPSVLFTGGFVALLVPLTRRYLTSSLVPLVVAVGALNPFVYFAAVEIRLYAMALFLSAANLLFFHKSFLTEDERPSEFKPPVWFVLTAAVMLYTQYYLGFLFLGEFVALVVLRRWRSAVRLALTGVVVAVLALPLLSILPVHMGNHLSASAAFPGVVAASRFVSGDMLDMVLPHKVELGSMLERILRYGFVLVAGLLYGLGFRRAHDGQKALLLVFVTVALLFVLTVSFITGTEMMVKRHYVGLFPHLLILIVGLILPWRAVLAGGARHLPVFLAVLLVGVTAFGTYTRFHELTKLGSFDEVATYVETREREGDLLLSYPPEAAETLSHYYGGPNQLRHLPEPIDFDETLDYSQPGWRLRELIDAQEAIRMLAANPAGFEHVWLVTNESHAQIISAGERHAVTTPLVEAFGPPTLFTVKNGTGIRRFDRRPSE